MASAIVELIVHVPIHWARRLKNVLVASLVSWIDHRAASKGAALAFYTLFSMTPILVLAIAVAAYFFGAEAAQGEIVAQLEGLVGPNGAKAMQALLAGAQSHSSGLLATLIASVLLLLGATSVFAELKGSLDELWGISPTGRSGFGVLLRTRLLSFGKYVIGLYLGNSGVASSFGAAGSLIALLLWVYYSAQIFFLGAEFTRHYALWFGSLQQERLRMEESSALAARPGIDR